MPLLFFQRVNDFQFVKYVRNRQSYLKVHNLQHHLLKAEIKIDHKYCIVSYKRKNMKN